MIPKLEVTEEQAEMLVKIFRNPAGREAIQFFQDMVETISFHEDPYVTAFHEGRRQLAIFLSRAASMSQGSVDVDTLDTNDSDNTGEII